MKNDGAFGLALLLAALAGWVDAVALALSGDRFVSFMSGNTTGLAAALAHRDWSKIDTIAAIIGLFVAGVMFGEIVEPLGGRRGHALVLAFETLVLGLGAGLHWPGLLKLDVDPLLPLAFAMGLQNATMHRAGGINIGLTYVTGALVQVGRGIAALLRGNGGLPRLTQYLALWLSLAAGAASGTLAVSVSSLAALSAAAAAAAYLTVVSAFLPR